uniref:Serine/threonine kinase 19 n=1 Tax=Vombatus ursinus TaxID=29139 RepID=A0A4X2M8F8_VOMUR
MKLMVFFYFSPCKGTQAAAILSFLQVGIKGQWRMIPRGHIVPSLLFHPRQLVNAGVLTVRDAGSWWLSVPGAGRFVKYFVKGRQAVLGMVRKSKYRELSLSELLGRRAPLSVRLGLPYHVHDLIGGQLLDIVPTASGTLLRLPET